MTTPEQRNTSDRAHALTQSPIAPRVLGRKSVLVGILTSGLLLVNGAKSSQAASVALAAPTPSYDAVIRWDGVGTQPLRASATDLALQRVRWVQPVAPPVTAGYALPGDVWERSV